MTKKIMIVDDDPVIVKYLENIFKNSGYQTCVATDGSKGMEIVKKENPDLITLDLEMPEEWGPRFYRKLSKEKHLKIFQSLLSAVFQAISMLSIKQ